MKFVIQSSELYARLQILGRVIASKNNLPILDGILFETQGDTLVLTASDNETTVTSRTALIECDANCRFVINAKTIQDTVRELPEQPLTFFVNESSFEVTIEYQNGHYRFMASPADEYPTPPPADGERATIALDSARLLAGIGRTAFATDNDEYRPVMTGIFFDVAEGHATLVATDRHKMVCDKTPLAGESATGSFILPKKPAALLKSILPKAEGQTRISWTPRSATIETGDTCVTCRLIEGRYPNYQSVIPSNAPNSATISRPALVSALRRMLSFSGATASLIKLAFTPGGLTVSREDVDFSMSAEEALLCDYQGSPINIGFKGQYLLELLNNLESEEITIRMSDPSRPGVVTPTPQAEGEDVLMLLMPMVLND